MNANDEVLTQKEAEKVISVLKKQGVTTRVTKVAADLFVVRAEDNFDSMTVLPEQKADGHEAQEERLEEAKAIPDSSTVIPDQQTVLPEEKAAGDEEIKEEEMAADEIMDEPEARAMQADLRRSGIMASVKKIGSKFAVLVNSTDAEKLNQK